MAEVLESIQDSRFPLHREGIGNMLQSNIAPVAQWIEQRFPKPRAARSIRVGGTIFINNLGLAKE